MTAQSLTQEKLKELFYYNPYTGHLIRKKANSNRVKKGSIVGVMKNNGYLETSFDSKKYYVHRLAWLYVYGEFPENDIDHINHVRDDNRLSNLRSVSRRDNCLNHSLSSRNKSGVTGVVRCKQTNTWAAEIIIHGEKKWLGRHLDIKDAERARKSAEEKYGFHENHGMSNA